MTRSSSFARRLSLLEARFLFGGLFLFDVLARGFAAHPVGELLALPKQVPCHVKAVIRARHRMPEVAQRYAARRRELLEGLVARGVGPVGSKPGGNLLPAEAQHECRVANQGHARRNEYCEEDCDSKGGSIPGSTRKPMNANGVMRPHDMPPKMPSLRVYGCCCTRASSANISTLTGMSSDTNTAFSSLTVENRPPASRYSERIWRSHGAFS